MKGYMASIIVRGSGETEDDAMENLEFNLHEYHRYLSIGKELIDVKIERCEIDEG